MRVAIASFAGMPAHFSDDGRIIDALAARGTEAAAIPWDDPETDWQGFDAVVIRSTWDYAQRRDEFIAAFADFLGSSYIGRIGSYRDEKILFVEETVSLDRALVKTRIVSPKAEPTSVHYRLYNSGGEWKVYDVVIEDISLVANYRSQFGRILARGSLDDLLRQLRDKQLR